MGGGGNVELNGFASLNFVLIQVIVCVVCFCSVEIKRSNEVALIYIFYSILAFTVCDVYNIISICCAMNTDLKCQIK